MVDENGLLLYAEPFAILIIIESVNDDKNLVPILDMELNNFENIG